MWNKIKSLFAKPKPALDLEGSTVIYFDDGSVEVPNSITIQEMRMLRFFPTEVIDRLEVQRNRVLH